MSSPRPLRLLVLLQALLLLVAASVVLYGAAGSKAAALGFITAQLLLVLGIGSMRRLAVFGYTTVLIVSTMYAALRGEGLEPVEILPQFVLRATILLAVIPYWGRFR